MANLQALLGMWVLRDDVHGNRGNGVFTDQNLHTTAVKLNKNTGAITRRASKFSGP